jgi:parallel beta-helix repeat protein
MHRSIRAVFTADLACPGTALIVAADGVTVDLNGFTLSGSGAGNGIEVAHNGVRIVRGTIMGFETGVLLGFSHAYQEANDNLVQRVTVRNNKIGVWMLDADRNTVTESRLLDNRWYGAYLQVQSDRNLVLNNRIDGNGRAGLLNEEGSSENSFAGNTISTNRDGVVLFDGSDNNLVYGNTIVSNAGYGVHLQGPGIFGNTVGHNWIAGNGTGIALDNGGVFDDNRIVDNIVTNNRGTGIAVLPDGPMGTSTLVSGNTANHNGYGPLPAGIPPGPLDDGIYVQPGWQATVTVIGNTANANADLGIEATGAVINAGGNTAQLNGNAMQCLGIAC